MHKMGGGVYFVIDVFIGCNSGISFNEEENTELTPRVLSRFNDQGISYQSIEQTIPISKLLVFLKIKITLNRSDN